MRRIEGQELERLSSVIETARRTAEGATCKRDHRGAVVFNDLQIFSAASNGPIAPFECNLEKCGDICGIYAMHAERLALITALESQFDLSGASVLHVRVNEGGEIQVSGDLRCEDCTGYMARVGRNKLGMKLKEFILLQKDGWTAYDISEADQITRRNLGI